MSKTIKLDDGNIQRTIDVNSKELSERFPFFEALFQGSYKETNQEIVELTVPNAEICIDIILGEPYQTKWQYVRERLICEDYFGIISNLSILERIKISPTDFDDLISLIDYFGYHEYIIKSILNNFPHDYRKEFRHDKLKEMIEKYSIKNYLIIETESHIDVWDTRKNKIHKTIKNLGNIRLLGTDKIVYSKDGKIYIHDINKNIILNVLEPTSAKGSFGRFYIDPYAEMIVCPDFMCDKTYIWDERGKIVTRLNKKYDEIRFSLDGKIMTGIDNRAYVDVYDTNNWASINSFEYSNPSCLYASLSGNGKIFVCICIINNSVYAINLESRNIEIILRDIPSHVGLAMSTDDKIAIADINKIIIVDSTGNILSCHDNIGNIRSCHISFVSPDEIVYCDSKNIIWKINIVTNSISKIYEYMEQIKSIVCQNIHHPKYAIIFG